MQEPVIRKLFLAFIQVHILHHAKKEPIYGTWMIDELKKHGYEISAGTIYPIFHNMEKDGLLSRESVTVEGKIRKYYTITEKGCDVLNLAEQKIKELGSEIGR
ncbi:MAG: PadR family transcriptional regulator [Lachnospiraceae bacterium]|nr:PadR family transcriptional regulator [Lachnospiraceae bacterium]MDD3659478.1 PadR family transcriptional regulator [Lachnospiraceae bacterium]